MSATIPIEQHMTSVIQDAMRVRMQNIISEEADEAAKRVKSRVLAEAPEVIQLLSSDMHYDDRRNQAVISISFSQ